MMNDNKKSTAQVIEDVRKLAASRDLDYSHLCELVAVAYEEAAELMDGDSHERYTNEDGKDAAVFLRRSAKLWRARCE